jgi:hypothetical protein
MPHPPQLVESQLVSMQAPPQFVVPSGHARHTPWSQYGVDAAHTFPQAPQLRESEFTEVHVPLQQPADVEQQA